MALVNPFTKIKTIILDQLKQGSDPQKISQSVAVGIIVGCMPIIGVSTPIALFLTHWWRLNHIVVQTVNYLVYPIQILLIPIFIKLSDDLILHRNLVVRPDHIIRFISDNPKQFFVDYSYALIVSVFIWLVLAFPTGLVITKICIVPIRKLHYRLFVS